MGVKDGQTFKLNLDEVTECGQMKWSDELIVLGYRWLRLKLHNDLSALTSMSGYYRILHAIDWVIKPYWVK